MGHQQNMYKKQLLILWKKANNTLRWILKGNNDPCSSPMNQWQHTGFPVHVKPSLGGPCVDNRLCTLRQEEFDIFSLIIIYNLKCTFSTWIFGKYLLSWNYFKLINLVEDSDSWLLVHCHQCYTRLLILRVFMQ